MSIQGGSKIYARDCTNTMEYYKMICTADGYAQQDYKLRMHGAACTITT